jgi:hypothetical protein
MASLLTQAKRFTILSIGLQWINEVYASAFSFYSFREIDCGVKGLAETILIQSDKEYLNKLISESEISADS